MVVNRSGARELRFWHVPVVFRYTAGLRHILNPLVDMRGVVVWYVSFEILNQM